jgi:glycosyltransferase involved in cell wall biosynthesis
MSGPREAAATLARRAVRRALSPDPPRRVPRLRSAPAPSGRRRRVWVLAPDWDRPSGGVRKLYHTVDVLAAAGVDAAVVHRRPGFRCTWFPHETRVVAVRDVVVEPGDVLVAPEIYGPTIRELPRGVPRLVLDQNLFVTLESLARHGRAAAAPYLDDPDLLAVAVVSEHNRALAEYLFPGAPVRRVRWAVDPAVWHPPPAPPSRRVAHLSRRRGDEAAEVLAVLRLRGALDGWEVVTIEDRTEAEVAELLRGCAVLLSFSRREGLGLPPLEALASGCRVVGFDGFAGREFFDPPHAVRVEDGDVGGFARAAERVLAEVAADPDAAWRAGRDHAARIAGRYGADTERADLLALLPPEVVP